MVNYCCVTGCGQHSRKNKLLRFYCLPKETERQEKWLKAASREDLLAKKPEVLMKYYRVCSRHFSPTSVKNKHLCSDAVPTLHLPGNLNEEESDDEDPTPHQNVICNSCHNPIFGFRYKCIMCADFDLCPKCEMLQVHSEHYVMRIPRKMKFKLADDLAQKWEKFLKDEHMMPDSSAIICNDSSDDEPITKYVKNYDSGIDLSDDVRSKIRDEVTRILNIPVTSPKPTEAKLKKKRVVRKRPAPEVEKISKKQKVVDNTSIVPEVAFADVNEPSNQAMDVKIEIPETFVSAPVEPVQPMLHMKVSDDLTELMIEMNDQKTIYKF